ncbi:MAG: hypothetical protein IPM82_08610 [Saprospiraceae bacterium]|nr:hypothetical protein [Saprospiraceae bacterium]
MKEEEETLDDLLMQVKNFERHLIGSGIYAEPVLDSYLNFLRYFKTLASWSVALKSKDEKACYLFKQINREEGNSPEAMA